MIQWDQRGFDLLDSLLWLYSCLCYGLALKHLFQWAKYSWQEMSFMSLIVLIAFTPILLNFYIVWVHLLIAIAIAKGEEDTRESKITKLLNNKQP